MKQIKVRLVSHNSDTQLKYGGHRYTDTRDGLVEGQVYTVTPEVHSWHTRYYIGDVYYNSVCFEDVEV